jgi:hypothetical protein
MSKPLKPGTPAPASGQYARLGPRGGDTGKEVTGVKGKPLPPTPNPGESYKLADRTRHKRKGSS